MPVRNGNAKKGSSLEVLKKFNDLQGLNERFKPFFFVIGYSSNGSRRCSDKAETEVQLFHILTRRRRNGNHSNKGAGMTKAVTATWNFDLEAGKDKGIVLLLGINSDGSKAVGYGIWDNRGKVWSSESNLGPMPNFTPKAWMIDTDLIPEI